MLVAGVAVLPPGKKRVGGKAARAGPPEGALPISAPVKVVLKPNPLDSEVGSRNNDINDSGHPLRV